MATVKAAGLKVQGHFAGSNYLPRNSLYLAIGTSFGGDYYDQTITWFEPSAANYSRQPLTPDMWTQRSASPLPFGAPAGNYGYRYELTRQVFSNHGGATAWGAFTHWAIFDTPTKETGHMIARGNVSAVIDIGRTLCLDDVTVFDAGVSWPTFNLWLQSLLMQDIEVPASRTWQLRAKSQRFNDLGIVATFDVKVNSDGWLENISNATLQPDAGAVGVPWMNTSAPHSDLTAGVGARCRQDYDNRLRWHRTLALEYQPTATAEHSISFFNCPGDASSLGTIWSRGESPLYWGGGRGNGFNVSIGNNPIRHLYKPDDFIRFIPGSLVFNAVPSW